ncbi:MAG: hypothetical protein AB7G93_12395 [Bdellovibrionales bacterium]
MISRWYAVTAALVLVGCASTSHRTFESLRPGMDKDEVLDAVGDPKRTFREKGQDHWIYIYFVDDTEFRRDVVFAEGRVIRVNRPSRKSTWLHALEGAESMEEFESRARQHQNKNEDFRTIDGSGDEDETDEPK